MSESRVAGRLALPGRVVDHPAWRAALTQARAALAQPQSVVAVLGSAGTGKTWLLRALLAELGDAGYNAVLLERGDSEDRPAAWPDVVLVDEADRIGAEALDRLVRSGVPAIVFAALPGFAGRVAAIPGAVVIALRPLNVEEATAFLNACAEAKGAPGWLTTEAAAAILAKGGGIPRLLYALLTAAAFVAALQAAPRVAPEHVSEAVSLRGDVVGGDVGATAPEDETHDAGRASEEFPAESRALVLVPAVSPPRRGRTRLLLGCAVLTVLFAISATLQPTDSGVEGRASTPMPGQPAAARATAPNSASPAAPDAVAAVSLAEVPPSQASGAAVPPVLVNLPAGVLPHVVLSFHQGDFEAERRGFDAVHALRSAGFAVSDPVPVLRRISDPGLSYFFAEDRAGAAAVGRALSGAFGEERAAVLRPDEPLPRPGTIEIRLSSDLPQRIGRAE